MFDVWNGAISFVLFMTRYNGNRGFGCKFLCKHVGDKRPQNVITATHLPLLALWLMELMKCDENSNSQNFAWIVLVRFFVDII